MRVAIVILNWNGVGMMRRFLPSVVEKSKGGAEVIVADNASTDTSLQMLAEEFPEVRTIVLDSNYGFAGGYNRALRQVESDYYLLLNSDVEVTEGWIDTLVAFMDSHPDCAACQPKILSESDRQSFEYAGACGGYIDRYGYPFCRGRIFGTVERDRGQYDTVQEVLWASGACLMIRRGDFWRVGGFDERFFAHNEEIDLCWRLSMTGRKIYCVPQSRVYHVGGGTLPQGNPRKTFLNFRNNLTMLYKNLPDGELARVMIARFFLDYVAALQSLLSGHTGDFVAVCKARRAFVSWRKTFDADRRRIQASRVTAGDVMRRPYSILWRYYVRRMRLFSQADAPSAT